ncbi:hypothetical protein CMUS01_11841 [Colletotrichum musicola]|uniref:Uncharacterized protein n=1 Tax=Colletotrichum musicola TaxID=2175873 RepID=A0A8H6JT31_9PEZI|nr:hypothetical protein CMUS01_11841 [Colletotrichum musicola]
MAARDFMSLQTYQNAKASYNALSTEDKILFSPERSLARRVYLLSCITPTAEFILRFSPQTDYCDVSPRFLMGAIRSLQMMLPGGQEGNAMETANEILLDFSRKETVDEDDGDVSSEEDRVGESELEDMPPSATSPRLLHMKEQYPLGPWPTIEGFREVRRSKEVVEEWAKFDEETARTFRNYTHDQAGRLLLYWGARKTPSLLCRLRSLGRSPSNEVISPETHQAFDMYSEQDEVFQEDMKGGMSSFSTILREFTSTLCARDDDRPKEMSERVSG